MNTDYRGLLDQLQKSVRSESEAQRQRLQKIWSNPLPERVSSGHAIQGLRVVSLKSDGIAILHCKANESRFREGDFLVLHRGDPSGSESVQCVLEYDDETELEVYIQNAIFPALKENSDGWIADESMFDLSQLYLDALDEVADTFRGRELILPLLSDKLTTTQDYEKYEIAKQYAESAGLDESQVDALAQAYASDLVYLIQGPPGTGKTVLLAHLARLLVQDGQRVLVTALTHRAINNALNKIVQVDPALPACKIGRTERATDLQAPNYEYFISSGFGELSGGYIIGATPFATRSEHRLSNVEFDIVIFDEASQITLPLALMGMLAGPKYVFIGDEHQLPPVVTAFASDFGKNSIFNYLSGRGYESMLTTTYRMNDALTEWPSQTFYNGALFPHPTVAERRLRLNPVDGLWHFALDPERPIVFLDLGHSNSTTRSLLEAETITELVMALLRGRLPPHEIGIVAPFRAQGRAIRNLLRKMLPDSRLIKEIVVDTVERMQGQEREVILVSLTTSNPVFASRLAEFYFQPERLNVAITRPRTKLILVGSSNVLLSESEDPQTQEWVELMHDLINNCATFYIPGGRPT